jgi:hypothetical protein
MNGEMLELLDANQLFDSRSCVKPILADVGVPMIIVQWPAMFWALIPVIVIEALLIRRWLSLSYSGAFKGTAIANIISTLIGVPLAWFVMFALELGINGSHGAVKTNSPVLDALHFIAGIAWLTPNEKNIYWEVPTALALLLIPTFFISVWIERFICRKWWKDLNTTSVKRAVFKANLASYAVLFAIACGFLIYNLLRKHVT